MYIYAKHDNHFCPPSDGSRAEGRKFGSLLRMLYFYNHLFVYFFVGLLSLPRDVLKAH